MTNKEEMIPDDTTQPLIPGLPNHLAELCLYRVSFPFHSRLRSVSRSWNQFISSESFLHARNHFSLSQPYLFVLTMHKHTAKIQWQVMDPRSNRWFVLPPMPSPEMTCPLSFACASLPREGKLFVLGGMRSVTGTFTRTTMVYRLSRNQWSRSSPMLTPRAFLSACCVRGKIVAVGGNDDNNPLPSTSTVEFYDPASEKWSAGATLYAKLSRYDAVALREKIYVTEGWTWPFTFSPGAGVYDVESDTWQEMRERMLEGWTGTGVVLGDRLFVLSDLGDGKLKVYQWEDDKWQHVSGERFPGEELERPYVVGALEREIYVITHGLKMAVGKVFDGGNGCLSVEWKVKKVPPSFDGFSPLGCQVIYA